MIKTLQNTLKQDKEGFVVPKSVQDAIPIRRLWPDGIFQFGSKFSKTIRFSDINYAIASKEDKTSMFLGYSELLNALDTGSTTKLTINNKRLNRQDFEQKILLPRQDDYLDGYRAEYNTMLMDKVTDSSNSVVQERYITLSVHRKSIEEARTFFDRVTADVTTRLSHLDAHSEELGAVERLRVLHDFYRTGEETEFHVDLRELMRKGHSFKDTICPDSLEFKKDYFVMGGKYGRVLFLKEYASYIKDSMISELTALNRTMMLSIDVIPVPTDEAVREMQNRLLGVETNVTNWQRRQNSNNNFSAVIEKYSEQPFDLVLLDIMLPKIDGYGVCAVIRQKSDVPIIMLTALDSEQNQIKGLDLQADDYITKPFSMPVLLRKIAAVLRRAAKQDEMSQSLSYKTLTLDLGAYRVYSEQETVDLTPREFEILRELILHKGRIWTRQNLLQTLWKYEFLGDERIVDTHIKNLRKKHVIKCIKKSQALTFPLAASA